MVFAYNPNDDQDTHCAVYNKGTSETIIVTNEEIEIDEGTQDTEGNIRVIQAGQNAPTQWIEIAPQATTDWSKCSPCYIWLFPAHPTVQRSGKGGTIASTGGRTLEGGVLWAIVAVAISLVAAVIYIVVRWAAR